MTLLPHLAPLAVAVPLLGALGVVLAPEGRAGRWVALLAGLGTVALSCGVAGQVLRDGPIRYTVGGWMPPLGIQLAADGLGAIWLTTVGLVMFLATLYAGAYLDSGHGTGPSQRGFWALWLFLWAGLNALFLSADLFNIYVTLELSGLAAVGLVAVSGSLDAWRAAFRYLLFALLGSLLYLLGISLVYGAHGTLDIALLAARPVVPAVDACALGLMTGGLLIKVALFPAHLWLPPAHGNAAAPVSAVLSGVVIKASFYLLVRLWFWVYPHYLPTGASDFLGFLGAAAVLWGGLQAIRAQRLKILIAYSTVAQVGYFFLLFPLSHIPVVAALAWPGALYLAISHAFSKAALFLAAGNVVHAVGHDRLGELQGLGRTLPISLSAAALAGASLMGLPPSGGFLGKWMLLEASIRGGVFWIAAVVLGGGLLAANYLFRFLGPAFSATGPPAPIHPVPRVMEVSALVLALVSVALGLVAPYPLGLLDVGAPLGLFGGAP